MTQNQGLTCPKLASPGAAQRILEEQQAAKAWRSEGHDGWLSLFVSITIHKLGLVGRPASLTAVVVFYILQIELSQLYTYHSRNEADNSQETRCISLLFPLSE